jgi:hypothetical protein
MHYNQELPWNCHIHHGRSSRRNVKENYNARIAKGLMTEGTLKMLIDHEFGSPLYENYPGDQRYYTWELNRTMEVRIAQE